MKFTFVFCLFVCLFQIIIYHGERPLFHYFRIEIPFTTNVIWLYEIVITMMMMMIHFNAYVCVCRLLIIIWIKLKSNNVFSRFHFFFLLNLDQSRSDYLFPFLFLCFCWNYIWKFEILSCFKNIWSPSSFFVCVFHQLFFKNSVLSSSSFFSNRIPEFCLFSCFVLPGDVFGFYPLNYYFGFFSFFFHGKAKQLDGYYFYCLTLSKPTKKSVCVCVREKKLFYFCIFFFFWFWNKKHQKKISQHTHTHRHI
mgnify:CR=1 FL=1